MNNETVREVCAEIQLQTYQTMFRTSEVFVWRDRILAAHEREMVAKDEMVRIAVQSAQARFDEEIASKDAEIARLNEHFCEYALPNHGCIADDKHYHKTVELKRKIARLVTDCNRLKAALKPVMEVHLNDGGTTLLSDSICAVAEAQRIVKKGESNEPT